MVDPYAANANSPKVTVCRKRLTDGLDLDDHGKREGGLTQTRRELYERALPEMWRIDSLD